MRILGPWFLGVTISRPLPHTWARSVNSAHGDHYVEAKVFYRYFDGLTFEQLNS